MAKCILKGEIHVGPLAGQTVTKVIEDIESLGIDPRHENQTLRFANYNFQVYSVTERNTDAGEKETTYHCSTGGVSQKPFVEPVEA